MNEDPVALNAANNARIAEAPESRVQRPNTSNGTRRISPPVIARERPFVRVAGLPRRNNATRAANSARAMANAGRVAAARPVNTRRMALNNATASFRRVPRPFVGVRGLANAGRAERAVPALATYTPDYGRIIMFNVPSSPSPLPVGPNRGVWIIHTLDVNGKSSGSNQNIHKLFVFDNYGNITFVGEQSDGWSQMGTWQEGHFNREQFRKNTNAISVAEIGSEPYKYPMSNELIQIVKSTATSMSTSDNRFMVYDMRDTTTLPLFSSSVLKQAAKQTFEQNERIKGLEARQCPNVTVGTTSRHY